jgi:TnpA family transposase
VLPIKEHTTDTHGYTQIIFGAYDLVGLRFAPRIRDIDRQRLYQHGTPPTVEAAELVKHKPRSELMTPGTSCSDSPLRCTTAGRQPLLLARLQAGSRRNPLARALQEYGRLIKTNFVLASLEDQQLRSRIGRQLNKGDQLHALRRFLFYANEGHVRHRRWRQLPRMRRKAALQVKELQQQREPKPGRTGLVRDELPVTIDQRPGSDQLLWLPLATHERELCPEQRVPRPPAARRVRKQRRIPLRR